MYCLILIHVLAVLNLLRVCTSLKQCYRAPICMDTWPHSATIFTLNKSKV